MATLSLVVPRFTNEKGGQVSTTLGVWLLCMSAVLYGVFLFLQTTTHAVFFEQPTPLVGPPELDLAGDGAEGGRHGHSGNGLQPGDAGVASMPPPPRGTADDRYDLDSAEPHSRRRNHRGSIVGVGKEQAPSSAHGGGSLHAGLVVKVRSNPPDVSFLAGIYLCNVRALVAGLRRRRGSAQTTPYHATLLFVTMVPVVLLAKSMAKMIKYGTVKTGAPQELGGFLVAVLVLSPEGITAIKVSSNGSAQLTHAPSAQLTHAPSAQLTHAPSAQLTPPTTGPRRSLLIRRRS
jgi:Ca2+/H+ antiporter